MLGALWLVPLAGLGLWALWVGDPLLTLAVALALLLSVSVMLWARWCLAGVSYRRALGVTRANFGEQVSLCIELLNLKPLPLTWLQVQDALPPGLGRDAAAARQPDRLDIVVAMLPYQRVVRRMALHCLRRGVHRFGAVSLASGDFLGALTRRQTLPTYDQLLVYPKVFPLDLRRVPSNQMLGRHAARRSVLADPVRAIGAREYQAGDPFRSIDWRASARSDALMVRVFEPSTTPILDIVLNVASSNAGHSRSASDELEFAISVAASLASHAVQHGWPVGLRGNTASEGVPLDLRPSAAPGQFPTILEALARADTDPTGPILPLLAPAGRRIPAGATLLLITTILDAPLRTALRDLHRGGRAVLVLHVAHEFAVRRAEPYPILRVDYDTFWTERDALVIRA